MEYGEAFNVVCGENHVTPIEHGSIRQHNSASLSLYDRTCARNLSVNGIWKDGHFVYYIP